MESDLAALPLPFARTKPADLSRGGRASAAELGSERMEWADPLSRADAGLGGLALAARGVRCGSSGLAGGPAPSGDRDSAVHPALHGRDDADLRARPLRRAATLVVVDSVAVALDARHRRSRSGD